MTPASHSIHGKFHENLHHVLTREIKRNDPNARDGNICQSNRTPEGVRIDLAILEQCWELVPSPPEMSESYGGSQALCFSR
ncbi:hypothetical protein D5086_028517 [Populus alba]|uniref:Uncharacterized protein n=1 Tax=Populus alba TaxID=43335 RepID=A0ACC4AYE6_POPAL